MTERSGQLKKLWVGLMIGDVYLTAQKKHIFIYNQLYTISTTFNKFKKIRLRGGRNKNGTTDTTYIYPAGRHPEDNGKGRAKEQHHGSKACCRNSQDDSWPEGNGQDDC